MGIGVSVGRGVAVGEGVGVRLGVLVAAGVSLAAGVAVGVWVGETAARVCSPSTLSVAATIASIVSNPAGVALDAGSATG